MDPQLKDLAKFYARTTYIPQMPKHIVDLHKQPKSGVVQKTLDLISKMEDSQKDELIENIGDLIERKNNSYLRKCIKIIEEVEPKNCDAKTLLQSLKSGNRKVAKIIPEYVIDSISELNDDISKFKLLNEKTKQEIQGLMEDYNIKDQKFSFENDYSDEETICEDENHKTKEERLIRQIINALESIINDRNELIEDKISHRDEFFDGLAYTLSTGKRIY